MSHPLPHARGPVSGRVVVPGSKSETNRALVLAALADGPSTITGALTSRDSDLMIRALRALGASVSDGSEGGVRIVPPARFHAAPGGIDCGLAGTVMRFVPPIAALAEGPTWFFGDAHASARPMAGLLDALRSLGATVDSDHLPFTVTGPIRTGGEVTVDSSATSQYISGLMLVGSLLEGGLIVRHAGATLPSRPHIEMTVAMLRDRGVTVDEVGETAWFVHPGRISARDGQVEPDLTNASVFLAAAAATGGSVTVPGWPTHSLQPGAMFLEVASRMGATVERSGDEVTLTGTGALRGVDVDLNAASELTPVVAALAALAEGPTTIRGVGHIRGHETDRLAALAREFGRLGIRATETTDGLLVHGGGGLAGEPFETYADHRMVHAAAILALRIPGLGVTDLDCVSKTMPDFAVDWASLVSA